MEEFLDTIHQQQHHFEMAQTVIQLPSKNYFYPIRLADLDDTSTSTTNSEESDCHSFFDDDHADEHVNNHDVDVDCCRLSAEYVFHSTIDIMDEDLSLSPYPFDATDDEFDEYSNDWVSTLQNDLIYDDENISLSDSIHSMCSVMENEEINHEEDPYTGLRCNEFNKSPTSTVVDMIEVGETIELENKFRNHHPLWTTQPLRTSDSDLLS